MTKKVAKNTSSEPIMSFKGFDKDLSCRGFQFEIGKTYSVEGEVRACENGFHACEHPFDVWGYYEPATSRFAVVEQSGATSRHSDDSKIASASITVKAELSLPEFVAKGVDYILSKVTSTKTESNTGYQSAASVSGKHSVAISPGIEGRARADETGAIVLVYRDPDNEWAIKHIFAAKVGERGIKAGVWYQLNADGEPVEVEEC